MAKKKKYKLKRYHISFLTRILFYSILFIFSLYFGIYFLVKSFTYEKEEKFVANENGNVSYKVCLKNNDFFDNSCLDNNMSYVASLINNIPLDFSYKLNSNINDVINGVSYEIKAKLVIYNSENNKNYFEKEYVLLSDGFSFNNKIDESVDIDYDYYNNIANKFKSSYGVDAQSYLEVYLITYKDYLNESKISVSIPLSQKAIEIKLNTSNININQERIIKDKDFGVTNWLSLIIGFLLIILSLYYFICFISLLLVFRKKISKYDKALVKILKSYDRLVVSTSTLPRDGDYNVLKINSFEELLDVRDNLRLPIMYYVVKEHEKSHFYILHGNNLYIYTLKAVDLK